MMRAIPKMKFHRPLGLTALCLSTALMSSSVVAMDCGATEPFQCLADYTETELKRLKLSPNTDQAASFKAVGAFSVYLKAGAKAAANHWEAEALPIYDLVLVLLLADQTKDAEIAALAAEKPFAFDADGAKIKGPQAFSQMKQDLRSFYHGEEDMAYARACVSDEAFKDIIGGSAELRKGACRVPYDTQSIQRAFGLMQLLKGVSREQAVEATMQYAYRVPSCTVASAIVEVAPTPEAFGGDEETAAWKVLDMATICAAELLIGRDL